MSVGVIEEINIQELLFLREENRKLKEEYIVRREQCIQDAKTIKELEEELKGD